MTDQDTTNVEELARQLEEARARLAEFVGGNEGPRALAITGFATLTELPPVQELIQLGRDPETARYTITLAGYPPVRIGTIKTLISRPEVTKVLAVAIQRVPAYCTAAKWTNAIGALLAHVAEVQEANDEAFEQTVLDWLGTYATRAGTDAEGAAKNRLPFTKDGDLYVSASDLAKYVRSDRSEQVRLHELRIALRDLGFTQTGVIYHHGRNGTKRRTSASYYHAPLHTLDLPDE